MRVTIRESTEQERAEGFNPVVNSGKRQSCPKYICFDPDDPERLYWVFGLIQGGDTKEEAVFWAERMASKNDLEFVRPEGWEDVVGDLPERNGDG